MLSVRSDLWVGMQTSEILVLDKLSGIRRSEMSCHVGRISSMTKSFGESQGAVKRHTDSDTEVHAAASVFSGDDTGQVLHWDADTHENLCRWQLTSLLDGSTSVSSLAIVGDALWCGTGNRIVSLFNAVPRSDGLQRPQSACCITAAAAAPAQPQSSAPPLPITDRNVQSAYELMSTKYPSTITLFANPISHSPPTLPVPSPPKYEVHKYGSDSMPASPTSVPSDVLEVNVPSSSTF